MAYFLFFILFFSFISSDLDIFLFSFSSNWFFIGVLVRIDYLFFLVLGFDIFGEIIDSSTISDKETSCVLVSSHCELTGPVSFWYFLCNYEASETIIKKRKRGTNKREGQCRTFEIAPHGVFAFTPLD